MKNDIFEIEFDKERGTLVSLVLGGDPAHANFIKEGKGLLEIHDTPWYDKDSNNLVFQKGNVAWNFVSFEENENQA